MSYGATWRRMTFEEWERGLHEGPDTLKRAIRTVETMYREREGLERRLAEAHEEAERLREGLDSLVASVDDG